MSNHVSDSTERLNSLSADRRKVLEMLLSKQARDRDRITRRKRLAVGGVTRVPCSLAQRRLWFIEQMEGGKPVYYIRCQLRLRGDLNETALRCALDGIVARHELLRSRFVAVDGSPWLEVSAEGSLPYEVVDLSQLDGGERGAVLDELLTQEGYRRFDLANGPLARGSLVRLNLDENLLVLTVHHIVSDGWSRGVMFSELAELYTAQIEHRSPDLPLLEIQYSDYAQWQIDRLEGEKLERQIGYWRRTLQDAQTQLELPSDRPRPPVQSYRGAHVAVRLDESLSTRLRDLARSHEMTLFMILHAGWTILLSRLSGQDDIVSGTPIANRQRRELEGLIGFFVNTLAIRLKVRDDQKISEFLLGVREVILEAYEYQDVPFDQVVEALQPERDLSRNPIFQVMFALQNTRRSDMALPGVSVTLEGGESDYSLFDLHLLLEEQEGRIEGSLYYSTDLFDQQTIERWISCLVVLLQDMVGDADRMVGALQILSETDRKLVVDGFNGMETAFPSEKMLHEIIEDQVEESPDRIAVQCEGQLLSYGALNAGANRMAQDLRAKGMMSGELVGICSERSLEMVVGLLAILKAGGGYVPLDPEYPADRLRHMLMDANPGILLIQEHLKGLVPEIPGLNVLLLKEDYLAAERRPSENLRTTAIALDPSGLAYVIYTSGSTGTDRKSVV